jgi:hypothetical protein
MRGLFIALTAGFLFPNFAYAGGETIVNFGNVTVNTQASRVYGITNDGSTPMKLTHFDISGMGFQANEYGCDSVPAHGQCQIEIFFWPTIQGFQTGDMVVQFDTDATALDFELEGWGVR